ncbi:hypothetical protein M9Y10_025189 [Tritrichomonas musculus]|uniref:Uncharacterized protein n=1 Tax=Tritrichomonas musculus TaxID=1915356 RepID=A0ABR2H9Z1_9EUKA
MSLINDEKILKLISPEWQISIMKKVFSPLLNLNPTEFIIIPFKQDDAFDDQKIDILAAEIRWLYSNSLVYKGKVDKLLKEAQEEIVFHFFEIKKPKEKNKKRYMSSIEINKKEMENDEIMEALFRHLNGEKNTRVKLFALTEQLIETNKSLPKLNKSASKNEIINLYKSNWKSIYPNLCVF